MTERLTRSDWKRIRQFAETPTYEREPEMLAPDAEDGGGGAGDDATGGGSLDADSG